MWLISSLCDVVPTHAEYFDLIPKKSKSNSSIVDTREATKNNINIVLRPESYFFNIIF